MAEKRAAQPPASAMETEQPKPAGPAAFDPWTATIEDSLSLPLDLDDPRSLNWQFAVAQGLKERRHAIENGSGFDVMDAIATCAKHGLSIPPWLNAAFAPRYGAVKSLRAKSWDAPEAFGPPHPKGTHLAKLRRDEEAAPLVYYCVRKLLTENPDRPVDNLLFDDVADMLGHRRGLARTDCARLYYAHRHEYGRLFQSGPDPAGNY